ncbi:MAG TPA: multicopper oxidase family protein [Anaerolineae bacterium]|nr:multicopper oxidase family protein [Anaerolineae bacterium]
MHQKLSRPSSLNRRQFLRLTGLGVLGLMAGSLLKTPAARASTPTLPGLSSTFTPDVELALTAEPGQVSILPGQPTTVWRYRAEVLSGPADTVQPIPDTYLGPILRFKPGQKVRVRFTNRLSEETIVHWHGLHVPEAADGHPRLAIAPGETYIYEYEIMDRPGMYWYHPHPHGRTGPQAYMGLAGLIIISDESEQALGLPSGDRDLPLVIQDRQFDANNQLIYSTPMAGFLGDRILVNGRPELIQTVEPATYRLRILNGSNARIYKLAWPDNTPFTVIGTDGGLLDAPVQRPYITLGPAERIDLLVDFSRWAGQTLSLRSLAFSGGGFMGGGGALPNGAAFDVLRFQVSEDAATPMPYKTFVPLMSGPVAAARRADRAWVQADRTFQLYMQFGQWTINGRTFQMEAVAPDEIVKLGTEEVWEFVNQQPGGGGGGMGGGMPHPMHIHGLQFQVVGRQPPTNTQQRANWETVKDGYVDDGWKDTILLMAGERVQVRLRFEDFTGLYLYHCHNLEHEDMGMMRNYKIVA